MAGGEIFNKGRVRPGAARGRWLATAWVLVASTAVGLFALSVPTGYAILSTVCTAGPCGPEQLSPRGAQTIERLGLSLEFYAAYNVALVAVFALACLAVAVAIFWRRSYDPVALYVSLTLILSGVFLPDWVELLLTPYPWLLWPLDVLNSLTFCALFVLFYLFPDGRFVPPWTRWLAVVWVLLQMPKYVAPGLLDRLPTLVPLVAIFLALTCLYAQIYRYRRVSGWEQRQQTKWVVFGLTATLSVLIVASLPALFVPSLGPPGSPYDLAVDFVSFLGVLLLPATFGIAILRHRLFDIDIIINRTIVYALLTASLAAVYLGGVATLQFVLRPLAGETPLAVVGSTLAIAALFVPLRRRIQAVIDRSFYRGKYDARKTLEEFSAKLRDETDLAVLEGDLVRVVEETVRPAHASLWLRETGRDRRP